MNKTSERVASRIPVWCEIVCRGCNLQSEGAFTSGRLPKRDLVKLARRTGWLFKHNEAFCGRNCLQRFEAEKRGEKPEYPKAAII